MILMIIPLTPAPLLLPHHDSIDIILMSSITYPSSQRIGAVSDVLGGFLGR